MNHEETPPASRVLGSLGVADGLGAVRLEDRYATDADDLWNALTDPARLSRWLGEIAGDLRPGGGFRAHFTATGWEGTGTVEVCEPSHRLLVRTQDPDEPGEHEMEAILTADGDHTILVVEERGMPMEQRPGYGAGWHVHLEDLRDHVEGRAHRPMGDRWRQLLPTYQALDDAADA